MRAARIHRYGPPEVLAVEDIPRPAPGPSDVLVRVRAAAVNPVDCKIRGGHQRAVVWKRLPATLGLDVAGEVVEVGAKVTRFRVGDEVFSSPTHRREGTYADFVAIDEGQVAKRPANVSWPEAASLPLAALTAYAALVDAGRLAEGQRVLVHAGSGGVGTLAIQMAAALGATVVTTCSERNRELVERLGAHQVVDYTRERFEEVVEPVDVVLDSIGGETLRRSLRCTRRGGTVASINAGIAERSHRVGPWLGFLLAALGVAWDVVWGRLRYGVRVSTVVRPPDGERLARIATWVEEGRIRPVVDAVYSLGDISEAHRHQETGRARGKVVVDVDVELDAGTREGPGES